MHGHMNVKYRSAFIRNCTWRQYSPTKLREQFDQQRSRTLRNTCVQQHRLDSLQYRVLHLIYLWSLWKIRSYLLVCLSSIISKWDVLINNLYECVSASGLPCVWCNHEWCRQMLGVRMHTCTYCSRPNHLLTYFMEQSPSWKANQFSASQETPRIVWKGKVHFRIHTCSPLVPILNQLDPVHASTSHFLKSHHNIIVLSMPLFPSLSLRFPHQNSVCASPLTHMLYMACPSHSSRFYHPKNTGWVIQTIKLLIM
jgi:hypothetical protein